MAASKAWGTPEVTPQKLSKLLDDAIEASTKLRNATPEDQDALNNANSVTDKVRNMDKFLAPMLSTQVKRADHAPIVINSSAELKGDNAASSASAAIKSSKS